ncbi:MAG TPA: hypothetical protein VFH42_06395 [Sporolactobacillaceae bacterium]|nr:hypothetical protein [Sporolactobacillaceae bacterium]
MRRIWTDKEDAIIIREVKMGDAIGIPRKDIFKKTSEMLEGRSEAACNTRYWSLTHDRNNPEDRVLKGTTRNRKSKEEQKDLSKIVILPHEVADEVNKVKGDEGLRMNFPVLNSNPKYEKLAAWLNSDIRNWELYGRAIINGFMPDTSPEQIIVERYTDPRSSDEYRDGIEFTLRKLGRFDILED